MVREQTMRKEYRTYSKCNLELLQSGYPGIGVGTRGARCAIAPPLFLLTIDLVSMN